MEKQDSRRNLYDLIDETLAEKNDKDFFTLSIVVGFENTTKFVQAHNNRESILIELTELVKGGGESLRLLGMLRGEDKRSVRVYCRVFQEYADEEWIHRYFDGLMDSIQDTAKAQGFRVMPTTKPEKN